MRIVFWLISVWLASAAHAMWLASAAHAITVTNLDDAAHVVVFEDTPGAKHMRSVEPGQSFNSLRHGGEVYVQGQDDRRIRYNANDALVIWDNGNMQIQVRRKTRSQVF